MRNANEPPEWVHWNLVIPVDLGRNDINDKDDQPRNQVPEAESKVLRGAGFFVVPSDRMRVNAEDGIGELLAPQAGGETMRISLAATERRRSMMSPPGSEGPRSLTECGRPVGC